MKKMLVIGDGDSVFIKDFVNQYDKKGVSVDLISFGQEIKNKFVRTQKNITVKFGFSFSALNSLFELSKIIDELDDDYDVIVIHFVYFFLGPYIFKLKRKTNRLVSVIWGSDFYRITSKFKFFLQKLIFKGSDAIIFTNPTTKALFIEKKAAISTELYVARFGLPALDEIDRLKNEDYFALCNSFNLPINKIKIMVGYNANLAHQQLKVIDKVAEQNIEFLDNIHLVFPLAYGGNSKELIKVALDQNKNIKYTILDQFYDFHEIAKLRSVIDILINIQPTDQFSGSMQETLYAGGWVLAGSWLPYQQLTELTSKLILIDSVDDVAEKLNSMVVNGYKKSEDNNELVRNFIKKSSSWEENIPIWDDILFPNEVG